MSQLSRDLSAVPSLVTQILAGRGYTPSHMEVFLFPNYEQHLHDPFLMQDMDRAVGRILEAAKNGEQVVVYGDYDIDGITATTVMTEGLAALGISARGYIPDRFEEGYGINQAALEKLKADGATLVISVDCGVTSVKEAVWAKANGLDLIITDHHNVPAVLPDAVAVVNPHRPDDAYPFKELAGVGVAFKLVQALQIRCGKPGVGQEKWLLDLVALGSVCDVVSLTGENRVLVHYGLKVLRKTRRKGLVALALVAGVDIKTIASHHLGFMLGPRMNAAGRLVHAGASLELVQTDSDMRAAQIAAELDALNLQRRADQQAILEAADVQAEQYAADPILLLSDAGWSHGVVGIVASKMVEKWGKPVLIAQELGEHTKGSGRGVPGLNLVDALRSQSGLFEKFGGHAFAAGFTIQTARLPELRQQLNAYLTAHPPVKDQEQNTLAELEITNFEQLNWSFLEALSLLEPFGNGNPEPTVGLSGFRAERISRMGAKRQHLRLGLRDEAGNRLAAVAFNMGDDEPHYARSAAKVIGHLNKNEYQGTTTLQFQIRKSFFE